MPAADPCTGIRIQAVVDKLAKVIVLGWFAGNGEVPVGGLCHLIGLFPCSGLLNQEIATVLKEADTRGIDGLGSIQRSLEPGDLGFERAGVTAIVPPLNEEGEFLAARLGTDRPEVA